MKKKNEELDKLRKKIKKSLKELKLRNEENTKTIKELKKRMDLLFPLDGSDQEDLDYNSEDAPGDQEGPDFKEDTVKVLLVSGEGYSRGSSEEGDIKDKLTSRDVEDSKFIIHNVQTCPYCSTDKEEGIICCPESKIELERSMKAGRCGGIEEKEGII